MTLIGVHLCHWRRWKRKCFMYGLMLLLVTYLLRLNTWCLGKTGGNSHLKYNCISSWVKTMCHSIRLSSLLLWSVLANLGLWCITLILLNTLTMNMASLVRVEALVCLVIMLCILALMSNVIGITCWSIGRRRLIVYLNGKTSRLR